MVALSGWDGALWAGAVRGVGAGSEPTSFSRFSEISEAMSEAEGVGAGADGTTMGGCSCLLQS